MQKKKIISLNAIFVVVLFGSSDVVMAESLASHYTPSSYIQLLKHRTTTSIIEGMGYVSDTESLSPTACFNPITITRSNQNSKVNFDLSESISQIADEFNVSAEFSADYGLFNANAMFDYFRQMKDDDYSLSLNYVQKVADTVSITYSYSPVSILNQTGKEIYQDGQNPMFRLFCGDRVVTAYEEGAALIMSMKITFQDKFQKETFKAHMGMGIGDFFKASAQVQSIASQYHLNGRILITGFQLGGDPSQLSRILDPSITSCDINNAASCQQAAAGLINYARNDFPGQFTKEGLIWKSPLVALGSYKKGYKLSDIGLKLTPSFITPVVLEARKNIATIFRNNQNDVAGFTQLLKNYPVQLNEDFQSQVRINKDNAEANFNLFLNGINGNSSAKECWLFPSNCQSIANTLITNLKPINKNVLVDENNIVPFPLGPIMELKSFRSTFWPTANSTVLQGGGRIGYVSSNKQVLSPFLYPAAGWIEWNKNQTQGTFQANGEFKLANNCKGNFKLRINVIKAGIIPSVLSGTVTYFNVTPSCKPIEGSTSIVPVELKSNPYYFEVL